jgi:hypothetical protein
VQLSHVSAFAKAMLCCQIFLPSIGYRLKTPGQSSKTTRAVGILFGFWSYQAYRGLFTENLRFNPLEDYL